MGQQLLHFFKFHLLRLQLYFLIFSLILERFKIISVCNISELKSAASSFEKNHKLSVVSE